MGRRRGVVRVRLRFLSLLKDYTGVEEDLVEVPVGSRIGDLRRLVRERWPRVVELEDEASIIVLASDEVVPDDRVVRDGEELTLLPPLVGG